MPGLIRKLEGAWDRFFFGSMDPLPYALSRIVLGSLFIICLLANGPNWERFYAANGIPGLNLASGFAPLQWWSLFYWGEPLWPIRLFWYVGLLAGLFIVLGYKTRTSSVMCWMVATAMVHRNSWATNAEDTMFRMYFFYLLFSPCTERLALDPPRYPAGSVPLWPARIVQIHIAAIYLISSPQKWFSDVAWRNGDAMYYVLINPLWSKFPWPRLVYYSVTAKLATWGSLFFEATFPYLVWFRRLRLYYALGGILLHVSIAVMLKHVGFFSLSMLPGLILFIDADFWRSLKRRIAWPAVPQFRFSRFPAFRLERLARWARLAFIVMLVFIPLRTACHIAIHNAGSEALWFDEALDFWIAQGVDPFAVPLQSHGSWRQVQKVNAALEASPGLHIAALRLASAYGNKAWRLRLPTYFFFVSLMILLAIMVYLWSRSWLLAAFALSIPFSYPQLLWNAFELKPYVWEASGVIAGWVALEVALKGSSPRRFLGLGLVLAFFSATRYSYFIYAGIILMFASFAILHSICLPRRKTLQMLWLPFITSAVLIFSLSLYWQGFVNTPISCAGPILKTGIAWFYRPFVLAGKPWTAIIAQILKNVAGPQGWPLGAFIGLWAINHSSRANPAWADRLAAFIISVLLLFAWLSLKGRQPWDMDQRWAAHFQALACLALAGFAIMLRDHSRNIRALFLSRFLTTAALLALLIIYPAFACRQDSYRLYEADQLVYELQNIAQRETAPPAFYVAHDDIPMFHYQLEKGSFQCWKSSIQKSFFETTTAFNLLTPAQPYAYWVLDMPDSAFFKTRLTPELKQSLRLIPGQDPRGGAYLYEKR